MFPELECILRVGLLAPASQETSSQPPATHKTPAHAAEDADADDGHADPDADALARAESSALLGEAVSGDQQGMFSRGELRADGSLEIGKMEDVRFVGYREGLECVEKPARR